MEEDTGKSLHVGGATGRIHGADHSLVDYNRAGIPLIEIVTKPIEGTGARAPAVARAYVAHLRDLVERARRLRRSDGPGVAALRRQPLAARRARSAPLGTRTETKNVNSFRSVERAVRYEVSRQAAILADGGSDRPGDPALARGHRRDDVGPQQGAGRGLPLLPRARPGPDRARPGVGRASCAASCPSRPPSGVAGCRTRGASPTSRCATSSGPARSSSSSRPSPPGRRRRPPRSGGSRSSPAGPTTRASRLTELRVTPDAGRRGAGAGRLRPGQRQARPPGARRRARGGGRAR